MQNKCIIMLKYHLHNLDKRSNIQNEPNTQQTNTKHIENINTNDD